MTRAQLVQLAWDIALVGGGVAVACAAVGALAAWLFHDWRAQ